MTHDKAARLALLIVLFAATGGVTEAAEPQPQPSAQPIINNVKVRPSSDRTGNDWSPTSDIGKSPGASNVAQGRPSYERTTDGGNGILNASDAKRIRTTRERITDDPAPSAIAPLQPPAVKP